jgi:hypothetical protein
LEADNNGEGNLRKEINLQWSALQMKA